MNIGTKVVLLGLDPDRAQLGVVEETFRDQVGIRVLKSPGGMLWLHKSSFPELARVLVE